MPPLSPKMHSIKASVWVHSCPGRLPKPQRLRIHNEHSFTKSWLPGLVLADLTRLFYLVLHKPWGGGVIILAQGARGLENFSGIYPFSSFIQDKAGIGICVLWLRAGWVFWTHVKWTDFCLSLCYLTFHVQVVISTVGSAVLLRKSSSVGHLIYCPNQYTSERKVCFPSDDPVPSKPGYTVTQNATRVSWLSAEHLRVRRTACLHFWFSTRAVSCLFVSCMYDSPAMFC